MPVIFELVYLPSKGRRFRISSQVPLGLVPLAAVAIAIPNMRLGANSLPPSKATVKIGGKLVYQEILRELDR